MARRRPPAKSRRTPKRPAKRPLWWRLLRIGLLGLFLLALLGVGAVIGGYWYFGRDLPDLRQMADYRPPEVTRIYAVDGTMVAEFFEERRTVVARAQIPEVLVHAVLSAEDADFYQHEGLDYMGMGRALYNSLRAGRVTGSGSTITQQTVKNLLLTPEKTFQRKAKEMILTRRLESRLSKDDILTIYLNAIYLGHGRYGVQEAAQYYFGVDVGALTLPQAALLAGIIQSPERLSPRKHPDRALARRAYVIKQMQEKGHIDAAAAAAAEAAPLDLAPIPDRSLPAAQWYVDHVREQVIAEFGEARFNTGGLQIRTALDLNRQRAALAAVRDGLRAIDARQKFDQPTERVPAEALAAWRSKRKKQLHDQPPPLGTTAPGRLTAIEAGQWIFDLGVGEVAVPDRAFARYRREDGRPPFAVGDVLPIGLRDDGPRHPARMKGTLALGPQGAMIVLDPDSRDVLAVVGGYDHRDYPFDRALRAKRQPGSTFKPFVYGAAFEARKITPATTLLDAPETYRIGKNKWWKPENYTKRFRGPITARQALALSINSVAVKVADQVGVPAVQAFARRAGITSPLADNLTVALGSSEVTPLELTNAFATIGHGGVRQAPRFIHGIETREGPVKSIFSLNVEDLPEPALDPAVAWLLTQTLRAVVTEGTGRKLAKFPRPLVGKSGTSNEARDAWFVGMLPDVVVTAWIGFDQPRPLGRKEAGGGTTAPIVGAYLEAMEKSSGAAWPPQPEGVVTRMIEPGGLLAPPDAEGAREAYFLVGTEPTETAPEGGEITAGNFMLEEIGEGIPDAPADPVAAADPVDPIRGEAAPSEDAPDAGAAWRPVTPVDPGDLVAPVAPVVPVRAAAVDAGAGAAADPAPIPEAPDEDEDAPPPRVRDEDRPE